MQQHQPEPPTSSSPLPAVGSLTPALFRRLHPKPYLEKFISEQLRPDGRPLASSSSSSSFRDASINLGSISTAPASALVRLGKTTVACGITLEVAPPDLSAPREGFIVPNVDLPPLCSPLFRAGPPSNEAQVLSTRLRDILLGSNVVSLEALLIEPSKAAFVVYLDVVCLNYDGSVLDAAVLACLGALQQLVLPHAEWDPDTRSTTCRDAGSITHPGRRLSLGPLPFTTSFGVFNSTLLPDPNHFEEELSSSHLTVALSSPSSTNSTLFSIYQAGAPLSSDPGSTGGGSQQLKACIGLARKRAEELDVLLREAGDEVPS